MDGEEVMRRKRITKKQYLCGSVYGGHLFNLERVERKRPHLFELIFVCSRCELAYSKRQDQLNPGERAHIRQALGLGSDDKTNETDKTDNQEK